MKFENLVCPVEIKDGKVGMHFLSLLRTGSREVLCVGRVGACHSMGSLAPACRRLTESIDINLFYALMETGGACATAYHRMGGGRFDITVLAWSLFQGEDTDRVWRSFASLADADDQRCYVAPLGQLFPFGDPLAIVGKQVRCALGGQVEVLTVVGVTVERSAACLLVEGKFATEQVRTVRPVAGAALDSVGVAATIDMAQEASQYHGKQVQLNLL